MSYPDDQAVIVQLIGEHGEVLYQGAMALCTTFASFAPGGIEGVIFGDGEGFSGPKPIDLTITEIRVVIPERKQVAV